MPGYFISNQGRVRRGNKKILKPENRKYGQVCRVGVDGERVSFTVSKMVREVFGAGEK